MHPSPHLAASQPAVDSEPDDDALVARVKAGELTQFAVLMRRHNRTVYRASRAILRSDDEAEDVMQHAYLRAFEHLSDYQGRARFSTWVTRIAVHEALARLRRSKRLGPLDDESSAGVPDHRASPEQQMSDAELRSLTEAAIDELPDDFRAVFVLRAVEQLSVAEVADSLGILEETVKTRYFRARMRLRQNLLSRLDAATPEAYAFHRSRCDRVVAAVLGQLPQLPRSAISVG
jgi:RNA polymerase sigma-70 factor (ECF subfamily)